MHTHAHTHTHTHTHIHPIASALTTILVVVILSLSLSLFISDDSSQHEPHRKDKWDSSGGNEVVSRVSSSIPQGTKDYISTAGQKLFDRQHMRSLSVFFGIGEERAFYVERSPSLLLARMQHNLSFFYLNYMMVFAILFILTMLTSVKTMVCMALLAGAWLYVVRVSQEGGLTVYGESVTLFLPSVE